MCQGLIDSLEETAQKASFHNFGLQLIPAWKTWSSPLSGIFDRARSEVFGFAGPSGLGLFTNEVQEGKFITFPF
jgi:hypothetical protein